jgi:hypothetical protein
MSPPRGFRVVEPGDGPTGGGDELAHVWADEITLDLSKPGLIDGLFNSTGMAVMYGESGSGKTFVALDLACHIAAGMAWNGMTVESGVVVYVAAESPDSVQRRIWAWKKHHGVEHLPLVVVTASVDLLNGSTDKVVSLLRRIREEHGPVRLVVIDTLARAMTGNENAPDDMGKFVAACGRIREACEGHTLIVHHCGKDAARGARGHSSLRAATDVELEVASGVVRVTKHRDEAGGRTFGFRLEPVELGENANGRVVTTCVAAACDPPDRAAEAGKRDLGKNERIALDALAAALCDHGREPPPCPDIPPQASVVTLAEWRAAILRYMPDDRPMKRRTEAADRAIKSLTASRAVRFADGLAWIPSGRTGRTGRMRPHEAPCGRAAGGAGATGKGAETEAPPRFGEGPEPVLRTPDRTEAAPRPHEPHAAAARPVNGDGGSDEPTRFRL